MEFEKIRKRDGRNPREAARRKIGRQRTVERRLRQAVKRAAVSQVD